MSGSFVEDVCGRRVGGVVSYLRAHRRRDNGRQWEIMGGWWEIYAGEWPPAGSQMCERCVRRLVDGMCGRRVWECGRRVRS
eukprot:scaffold48726_cov32-Phaeocystis_antarctica.AAC.1